MPPSGFDGVWKRNGNAAALLFVVTRLNQSRATSAVSNRPTSSRVLRRIRREWSVSRRNVRVWDELDGYLGPLTKAPAQSGEMRLHCCSIARYSCFSRKGISPKSQQSQVSHRKDLMRRSLDWPSVSAGLWDVDVMRSALLERTYRTKCAEFPR